MKKYTYKAKKGPVDVVEGFVYALSEREAVDKIVRKGLIAVHVEEDRVQENKRSVSFDFRSLFGIRLKEIIVFTKQLSSLIKAGLPILRALSIVSEQTHDSYFKGVINNISEHVKNGESLSSGLKDYPRIFSDFYRAMVRSGENSGAIHTALDRVTEYYTKRYDLISKVRMALAYPVLILVVGILTLVFVFTNVIPRIVPIILKLNMELPLPTKILIQISMFMKNNWIGASVLLVFLALLFKRSMRNIKFSSHISRLKLRTPLIGEMVFKTEMVQFSRAVAMALRSGISVIQAINISIPILNEYGIISEIKNALKYLESGGSLGEALKKSKIFPPFVYSLIKVGEESGNLDDALTNISETYESDVEEVVKTMTNLLEPLLVLAVGLVVGFIVVAVLLPVFNLNIAGV